MVIGYNVIEVGRVCKMASVIVKGNITENGQLELDTLLNMESGPVEVEIRPVAIEGITLGEILDLGLVGIWADRDDIGDSVEFARELRREASRRGGE